MWFRERLTRVASASSNPHFLDCISSWLREINSADVVNSPLLGAIVNALAVESSFDAAVSCLCTLYHDTREVDESLEVIQLLYPHIVALRPRIKQAADAENTDTFRGLTRLFAEAGEAWVVLIARLPAEFRGLVDGILECCARDWDKDAFSLTFLFWYEFKQMLTMDKYQHARRMYSDAYSSLVDIMIKHMEFPAPESGNEKDLFDGDREQEERFREFRHQIGDVLKDCCEVISVAECLGKAFVLVQKWIQMHSRRATETMIPQWQELEAPLFAMRSMGGMVSPEEDVVMKQVIPLMVQIPNHEKLQFQAIMALARYTEWTAQHPEFLQPQLRFIIAAFDHPSPDVVKAAALAFRFFGQDCRKMLAGDVLQLQGFYNSVLDKLYQPSQEEITEGVAWVISAVVPDKIYASMKLFCDPIMERLKVRAGAAKGKGDKDPAIEAVAGMLMANWWSDTDVHRHLSTADVLHHHHSAILRGWRGKSSGQVLLGDITPSVRHCRYLSYLGSDSRTTMPMLATHGSILPNGGVASSSHAGRTIGQWLSALEARLLPLGHGFGDSRICRWHGTRVFGNLARRLPFFRGPGICFSQGHERNGG